MITYLRSHIQIILMVLTWVVVTVWGGPVIYLLLPISVFLLRSREMWPEILFGFLFILVLSDMDPMFGYMRRIKTAKYGMIIALTIVFLIDQARFMPYSKVFSIFLPFFAFSLIPLLRSEAPLTGIQKTLSYALLYLVVPNYVLMNFRRQGWVFFKNLIYFIVTILVVSYLITYIRPHWVLENGRYRGMFGNPNGLGIFTFLSFVLTTVVVHLRPQLFSFRQKVVVFGVLIFFLVECGSRTSITATLLFFLFSRFFRLSPFIGFVVFMLFLAVAEVIQSNLTTIVIDLGLEKYFRIETLQDGSGRYFAWGFAWQKINEDGYFLLGGGFGSDEYVMRQNYPYLRSMGHHGGVHNSYLTLWFNLGIIGLLVFFRSFVLIFVKANKRVPIAFAVMFATLFSIMYESWLAGSLNPYTILLLTTMTLLTEEEIHEQEDDETSGALEVEEEAPHEPAPPLLVR